MKTNKLTASQYLAKCQNIRNRKACAWIDFRETCFRIACYSIATVALVVTGVNCIFAFLSL